MNKSAIIVNCSEVWDLKKKKKKRLNEMPSIRQPGDSKSDIQ